MPGWVGWLIGAAGLLTALAVFWKTGVALVRWARRISDFFDDWKGQPARPGVPERPGVMARLADFDARLANVEHELRPNGGRSLHDKVNRIHVATVDGDTPR